MARTNNAHGTNPNIFSGEFQDLDFGLADDVASDERHEKSKWASVEELAIDFGFEDRMIAAIDGNSYLEEDDFDDELEMTTWSSPLLGSDYHDDVEDWHDSAMSEDYLERLEAEEAAGKIERELLDADSYMPAFSSNRDKRILTWAEADERSWRYYRNSKDRKPAKFGIDGKQRGRKDFRDCRWSIRQAQVEMSDWYHLEYYGEYDYVSDGWPAPAVPTFGIETVGLNEEDASYYEAEFARACNAYRVKYTECRSDNSSVFDPITNAKRVQEVWERHLFPERFEDYRPYRYSDYDWYDDFDYYDQFYNTYDDYTYSADSEYDDYPDYDDGPTLAEWLEMDLLAEKQLVDEEAEQYMPSFSTNKGGWRIDSYQKYSTHNRCTRRNFGRKLAKWRGENGRRARKDLNYRWSPRHMQMQVFDQFYAGYTAEQYLTENARVNLH